MLQAWQNDPSAVKELTNWLVARLEELRTRLPANPEEAIAQVLTEALDRAKSTG
jgi:hypothetical protein